MNKPEEKPTINNPQSLIGKVSREEAKDCIRKLLVYIGEDLDREGLLDTPERVVDSFDDLYAGYRTDINSLFESRIPSCGRQLVMLSNIEFTSICEHHMLPFKGVCHIGYIPGESMVGISKLARLVDACSRRLQIQEGMTSLIAEHIHKSIAPHGVAVLIQASHSCMTCRGANQRGALMITSKYIGEFISKPEAQREFLELCRIPQASHCS